MTPHRPDDTPAPGSPAPPGATCDAHGVNFSLHAPDAVLVELVLFAADDDPRPERVVVLDPDVHRTGDWWHAHVPGIGHGQVYGWRVENPGAATGNRLLLDPWGRGVTGLESYDRRAAARTEDNAHCALRSVVIDPHGYDWEDDAPPPEPDREIIYEMHVAAFTRDPSSGVPPPLRGTYGGVAHRLEHLRDLGVTTVELLPVQHFDPQDAPPGRTNYWGYSPVSWFAPHAGWAADPRGDGPLREMRDLVKVLHRAGLRVILDVVYNHTAEGEADGPVLCWRGLDPTTWYLHDGQGAPLDVTGCGNTVNANHPVTRRLILDSLRWWVQHVHVDGFRFDLAAALARGADGEPLDDPPLLEAIAADPVLAGCRLIAEPWDAAGLYLLGRMPGGRFACWNGPFRDDVRRLLRGDPGLVETLMARLVGSPDLVTEPARGARQLVNFVTAHDGFTLRDLVSYQAKRNEANGEDNRDGSDDNLSWNCGHEGEGAPPEVEALRRRQVRNFLCLLLFSHGTPMLLMGDEMGATRRGNNNPWCQDNDLNWLDWNLREKEAELLRFSGELVRFARSLPVLQDDAYWHATSPDEPGDVTWHGRQPGRPDWRPDSRCLAFTLEGPGRAERVHVMLNAASEPAEFTPPPAILGSRWRRVIDTAATPPADIDPPPAGPLLETPNVPVAAHSVVVLLDRS